MRQAQLFDFVENEINNNSGPVQAFKKLRERQQEVTLVETPLEKDQISELLQINDTATTSSPDLHAAGTDKSSVTDKTAPIKEKLPLIDENDPNKPLWDEIGSGSFDRNPKRMAAEGKYHEIHSGET